MSFLPGVARAHTIQSQSPAVLAEQIVVLREVKALRFNPEQLAVLVPAVTKAQKRLAEQAQSDLEALAALRGPVTHAREQLMSPGIDLKDPHLAPALKADQMVTDVQRAAARNQARLRNDLAESLHHQLETLLSPEQATTFVKQALEFAVRVEQDRLRQRQALEAANGSREADDEAQSRALLERFRHLEVERYEQMSRSLARRLGGEGTFAYQHAMALFDRVRKMPDGQFNQESAEVAEAAAVLTRARSVAMASTTTLNGNPLDTWIERYLLSPQSPAALQGLAGTR
jgi:hypothetical protein